MGEQTDEEYYEGRDFVTGEDAMAGIVEAAWALVVLFVILPISLLVGVISDRVRRPPGRHRA